MSTDYTLHLNGPRKRDPNAGETPEGGPFLSLLTEHAMAGDWSWKPHRYKPDIGVRLTGIEIRTMYPNGYVPGAQLPEPLRSQRAAELERQMPTYKPTPHPQAHRL